MLVSTRGSLITISLLTPILLLSGISRGASRLSQNKTVSGGDVVGVGVGVEVCVGVGVGVIFCWKIIGRNDCSFDNISVCGVGVGEEVDVFVGVEVIDGDVIRIGVVNEVYVITGDSVIVGVAVGVEVLVI